MATIPRYTGRDLPFIDGKPKVFILQGSSSSLVTRMFAEVGFAKASGLDDADLVVYTGGSDVSPEFYGQSRIQQCGMPDRVRDERERKIFKDALKKGIPQMGICRGAQFLHVMCGGTLWQHVTNHTRTHLMFDITSNVMLQTSSTHHQMMKFNEKMVLIGCCDEDVANFYEDGIEKIDFGEEGGYKPQIEVEVCAYEEENVLCIQGHPEYGPMEFTSWSMNLLKEWFNDKRKAE
jgi:putative glutamine amidotransferase